MQKIFIKTPKPFNPEYSEHAPAYLFRRKFTAKKGERAELSVCGLGFGYYYLNGKAVSKDLFTAPNSDYNRILWYNVYDVTGLLNDGENVFCAILGNAFFNESFPSHWHNDKSCWRDNPKLFVNLSVDGKEILTGDEKFKVTESPFLPYNHLRSGETFDAREYDGKWKEYDFPDNGWDNAVTDVNAPKGILQKCDCPPIVEAAEYDFVKAYKTENGLTLDFGQNMSGYIRLNATLPENTAVTFRHAEEINEDGTLKLNGLNVLYPTVDFQTDRYISSGKPALWSPKFTYHGFRYVSVEGFGREIKKGEIKAVFVHQKIDRRSYFECSDDLLNKIYQAGIISTYSNMHYVLTDCPTREKFGWMNDAQASFNQILINFAAEKFLEKWGEDIKAAVTETGEVTTVVPSDGYEYGRGPVADGALFELPYRLYLYTGDKSVLKKYLPYLERYYGFYSSEKNQPDAWIRDWDGFRNRAINGEFIKKVYAIKFAKILSFACGILGKDQTRYEKDRAAAEKWIRDNMLCDGKCKEPSQTVLSMLIVSGAAEDNAPLYEQLKQAVDQADGHLQCGMMGIKFLYDALSETDGAEYAYKVITAKGEPGFDVWFQRGATTLWETWKDSGFTDSRNHQMFSNVLAWFFEVLLGLRADENAPAYKRVELKPRFIKDLTYCKGGVETAFGRIDVEWKRENGGITFTAEIPSGVTAVYKGTQLKTGKNAFAIKEN